MATGSNPFDFAGETLATLLAKVVSDGTYDDILTTLKVDAPGSERAASAINLHVGQLWGNVMDDYLQASYAHIRDVALGNGGLIHTTGAAKTGAYTALAGELVRVDASGGTFPVDVPVSPADNTRFGIVETANDATQVTIDGGANIVIGPGGTSGTTILVGSARGTLTWEFSAADSRWSLVSEAGAVAGGGAHAASHESEGSDEISVLGLSGLLADGQTPLAHAASHSDGGSDEITVENLATSTIELARGLQPDGIGGLAFAPILNAQPGTVSTGIVFHADVGNTASYAAGQNTTLLDVVGGEVGTIIDPSSDQDGRINFDGADTLINFGPVSAAVAGMFDSTDGVVEVWCYIRSDGELNRGVLIDAGQDADGKNFSFALGEEVGGLLPLVFVAGWTTTDGVWITTVPGVPKNVPVCLQVRYNNNSVTEDPTFFMNGVSLGAVTETQTPVGTYDSGTTEDLIVGNFVDVTQTFDGWIETVTMWSTPLKVSVDFLAETYNSKAARFGLPAFEVGAADEVLTSNGPGLLPTWQPPSAPAPVENSADGEDSTAFGSGNTRIRRWGNAATAGTTVTWVQSASNGDYILLGEAGYYGINITYDTQGGSSATGIGLNAGPTLSNTFVNAALRMSDWFSSTVGHASVSWTGYLPAGTKVWASTLAASAGGGTGKEFQFSVYKLDPVT